MGMEQDRRELAESEAFTDTTPAPDDDHDDVGEMPSRLSEEQVEVARAYVASVRWQHARAMPGIPHWYTVKSWRWDLADRFESFAALIESAGVRRPWPPQPRKSKYHNAYLVLDGWEYWWMEPVINRQTWPVAHGPDSDTPAVFEPGA
jgi:hypothetical protein